MTRDRSTPSKSPRACFFEDDSVEVEEGPVESIKRENLRVHFHRDRAAPYALPSPPLGLPMRLSHELLVLLAIPLEKRVVKDGSGSSVAPRARSEGAEDFE